LIHLHRLRRLGKTGGSTHVIAAIKKGSASRQEPLSVFVVSFFFCYSTVGFSHVIANFEKAIDSKQYPLCVLFLLFSLMFDPDSVVSESQLFFPLAIAIQE